MRYINMLYRISRHLVVTVNLSITQYNEVLSHTSSLLILPLVGLCNIFYPKCTTVGIFDYYA